MKIFRNFNIVEKAHRNAFLSVHVQIDVYRIPMYQCKFLKLFQCCFKVV